MHQGSIFTIGHQSSTHFFAKATPKIEKQRPTQVVLEDLNYLK
jgi:hypothetical protein